MAAPELASTWPAIWRLRRKLAAISLTRSLLTDYQLLYCIVQLPSGDYLSELVVKRGARQILTSYA